jgi:NADH-quinone oxidoreductase subunit J
MNAVLALTGAIAVLAALLAVTRATIVHALLYLVVMLLALAALFFALGASFAGALQILVYAGAIVAVFVFIVMTVDAGPDAVARERRRLHGAWRGPLLLVAMILLPLLAGPHGSATAGTALLPARAVGGLLFGPWALAVELVSFLLLAALLGARILSRPPPQDEP